MTFSDTLNDHIITSNTLFNKSNDIDTACTIIYQTFNTGNKLFTCGNGGSAADSQHLAAEFMVRFKNNRKPLPCIALSTDTSIITACANDFNYDNIFARQLTALGKSGDTLLAFSTSGKSPNVINAMVESSYIGMNVILLSGQLDDDSHLKTNMQNLDGFLLLDIPSKNTARIQECHQIIYHYICEYIDNIIGDDNGNT